jgi:hypothetical protein
MTWKKAATLFLCVVLGVLACQQRLSAAAEPAAEKTEPASQKTEPAAAEPTHEKAEPAADKEVELVQGQIQELMAAVFKADVDTVLKYTHPMVVGALGGRAIAAKVLKPSLDKLLADGVKLEEFTFPAPPIFLKGTEHEFVIVPTKMIMDVNGTRVQSLNYQFGARAVGETQWLYIEGSKVNQKNVVKFFSDFPKDHQLPTTERTGAGIDPDEADERFGILTGTARIPSWIRLDAGAGSKECIEF